LPTKLYSICYSVDGKAFSRAHTVVYMVHEWAFKNQQYHANHGGTGIKFFFHVSEERCHTNLPQAIITIATDHFDIVWMKLRYLFPYCTQKLNSMSQFKVIVL
jgi:hypothetical protein